MAYRVVAYEINKGVFPGIRHELPLCVMVHSVSGFVPTRVDGLVEFSTPFHFMNYLSVEECATDLEK